MKEKKGNIFLLLLCVILGLSCSTGRNTSSSRAYHELKTRYNVFHNAQESYDNTLNDLLLTFPGNRYELLSFYTTNDVKEKTSIGGPFDIVVDKTAKAINEHSISAKPRRDPSKAYSEDYRKWLKQEEFNPFMSNVRLLLGKAHVQNGDYDLALSAFSEILNIYPYDINLITEVQLWMLRTYTEMDRFYDAQNLIYVLRTRKMPHDLEILFTEFYAHYLLESSQFKEAVPYIRKVIDAEKKITRKKWLQFLLGQVYTILADYNNANKTFEELKGLNTPKELSLNADIYQYAFSSGEQHADSISNLLKSSLINEKDNVKPYSDLSKSTNYLNSEIIYKDSFQLYWDAYLQKKLSYSFQESNQAKEIEREFILNSKSPHLLFLLLSDQPKINELLFHTANFNYSNFKLRTFKITPVRFNKRIALKIDPFNSLEDASNYLQIMRIDSTYLINIPCNITPIIISNNNFNILQNNRTLEEYNMFYTTEIGMMPEDILQIDSKVYNENIEELLHLKSDSKTEPLSSLLMTTDIKTSDLIKPSDLKSSLERKAAEMMKRTNESTSRNGRAEQIKKREQLRKKRIKQREQKIKERERIRDLEIKLREKERERRIRAKKRS